MIVKRLLILLLLAFFISCGTSSLKIDAQASLEKRNEVCVNARLSQVDTDSIINSLKSGNTVRVTWIMSLSGYESQFFHYARIDTVGKGYHLFNSLSNADINVFNDEDSLLDNLLSLKDYLMYTKEGWGENEMFRIQAYMDEDLKTPWLSIFSIFSRSKSSELKIEREGF